MRDFIKMFFAAFLAFGSIIGVLFFLMVGGAGFLFRNYQGKSAEIPSKALLHLNLHGDVVERSSPLDFRSIISSRGDRHQIPLWETQEVLKKAASDARIEGLTVYLSRLNVGWASAQTLHRAILGFRNAGKPVYVYTDGMNEIEYMIATAGSKIFMQPQSSVELNGLSLSQFFFKDLLGKLGVEPRIFRVGKFKAAIEPFTQTQMSAENRAQNQQLLDEIWQNFRDGVKLGRKTMPVDELEALVRGGSLMTSEQLVKPGIIDGAMYMDEVDALILKETGVDPNGDDVLSVRTYLRDMQPTFSKLSSSKNKIAVLFTEGTIVGGSGGEREISLNDFLSDMYDIREDEDVRALVVRVNSPGGDASAADAMWRDISRLTEKYPVVISMGDYAASGGYYMSAGANYIFAEPSTITGSIGVFGLMFGVESLADKAYLHTDTVKTHPLSDMGSSLRAMSESEKALVQDSVDKVYSRFLQVVEQGRKIPRATLEEIAQGRVWTGLRAKELKLVDELGGLDTAISKAAELAKVTDYSVETFPSKRNDLEHLFEMFGEDMEVRWTKKIRSLLGLQKDDRVQARLPYLFEVR